LGGWDSLDFNPYLLFIKKKREKERKKKDIFAPIEGILSFCNKRRRYFKEETGRCLISTG